MKPIFGRGPSLQLRLFFAVIMSASLMLADSRLGAFAEIRYLLNSMVAHSILGRCSSRYI